MAITRQKKEETVAKITAITKSAKTLVFASFKGLTVAEQNEMRKAFRPLGVGYTVAKKSLLQKAIPEMPELDGEIALVHGQDELAPARELAVFVKKFGEHLAFARGVFAGNFVGKNEITSIAAIPGIDELRARLVQLINSPLQRFAVVLHAKAEKQG